MREKTEKKFQTKVKGTKFQGKVINKNDKVIEKHEIKIIFFGKIKYINKILEEKLQPKFQKTKAKEKLSVGNCTRTRSEASCSVL